MGKNSVGTRIRYRVKSQAVQLRMLQVGPLFMEAALLIYGCSGAVYGGIAALGGGSSAVYGGGAGVKEGRADIDAAVLTVIKAASRI